LLLIPLFYVYSIFRHRLRGADAALKRAAVYYLLLILLLSIYLAAFAGLTRLAADLTINWQLMGIGALVTVGVLLLLAPLRQAIERLTNWVWYGNEAPYAGLLERLAESLSLTLDRETLRHLLVDELASAMHLSKSALLLRDQDDSLTLLKAIGFDFPGDSVLHLSLGSHLATYLETVAEPVIADKARQALKGSALPADEQAVLSRTDVAFWLPLVSAGTLQGLLLIGFRQNGDVFTAEEKRILATLARQSGVAAHNVRLMEQVHAGRRELARAHQQLLVGREQELRKLAHNLHDSVVQQLIGISYQLAESRRRAGNGGDIDARESQELGANLETIRQGLLDVVKQLRGLVSELRPAGLEELGLTTALEGYVARLRREMGLEMPNILLDLNGSGDALPDPVAICLFRVAQEALRNALQHAGAENIALSLDLLADEAALSVQDDGCGFHVPTRLSQLTQTDHFGLVGMAERVSWAGGRLAIRSQPGEGTAITVQIPLNGGEVDNEQRSPGAAG
jgi:signal transduction histidine kinase